MLSKALADLRASESVTVASARSSREGSAASRNPGSLTNGSSTRALAAWVARWVRIYGAAAGHPRRPSAGNRDLPQQLSGDALVRGAGAACGTQVFGELLVVEAVHGPILIEGLDQVEARLLDQPGDVSLRIGLIVGERCR